MAHKWLKWLAHPDVCKRDFSVVLFFADGKALPKIGSFAELTWAQIQALKRFSY